VRRRVWLGIASTDDADDKLLAFDSLAGCDHLPSIAEVCSSRRGHAPPLG
jgi:hypothetical protein